MTGLPDRLAAALADRYRLERELGAGGIPPRTALSGLTGLRVRGLFDVAADGDRLVWTFSTGGGSALLLLQGWQGRMTNGR